MYSSPAALDSPAQLDILPFFLKNPMSNHFLIHRPQEQSSGPIDYLYISVDHLHFNLPDNQVQIFG